MANTYDVGDKPTITGTFTQSGTVADPAAVYAYYKAPSGNPVSYVYGTDAELSKISTGVYSFDISINEAGTWWYRMDDNDANVATEGNFLVRPTQFA